ncbi:MAG: asparagine synthase (glutamine-hydrolyzing) [Gloeobacteraceae cyanobacterium ES-bin-316]|nr:asparagine synthase (glutamine-hydrolyzing) [Ferruginibacter sp.]
MCGIAGIVTSNPTIIHPSLLQQMADSLAHRGPDGDGLWNNDKNMVGMAHRRLAIIDLSAQAAQPMHYLQRYSIVYNGEIYNYIELRKTLQNAGYMFHTKSDTEVILAAYDCYKEKCVQYLDGMFAFAIWDEMDKQLFAARDRFGEKPFYYYREDNFFAFASEMKALWAIGIPKQVEDKMLLNYLTLGHVQNPADKSQTFYTNIVSLLPAHYLRLDGETQIISISNYWDIDKQTTLSLPDHEILEQFENLFSDSVAKKMRSDVPVGASLSGGLDSSSIAYSIVEALKKNKAVGNFKTFSAIFPGFEKDEHDYIKQVTEQFSFENYTVTPTGDGLIKDFEKLCYHQEEPFPSSSIYAQYKVFELASQHNVKVMIDGQGADEILAGYHKYLHWYIQELISRNKFSLAKKERKLFRHHKMNMKWGIPNLLATFLPSHVSIALEERELKHVVNHPDISRNLLSVIKGREWDGIHKPIVTKLNDILYFNTMEFGLEELLRYSDRNSMAHGTEVRLPFLNDSLVQFVFSLPSRYKISEGFTKSILRRVMDKKLPDSIVWRTDKIGYEPPQQQWMQHKLLIDYIHEAKKKLVKADLLKPQVLQKRVIPLHAHQANNNDWRYLCAARMV